MAEISEEVAGLMWYHANTSRHVAESLLMQNGSDGAYLLRPSSRPGELALSVRCQDSVKHFNILWTQGEYHFGMVTFRSISAFVDHFQNQPLLAGDSGVLTHLKFPYPRDVQEPETYERIRIHAELGYMPPSPRLSSDLALASKEGYLTKLGGMLKNWKNRWFVLVKNELRYYKDRYEKEPIRTLDLRECTMCCRDSSTGKDHCFKLILPWRTFYMYANTAEESKAWINILQWKLERISKGDS